MSYKKQLTMIGLSEKEALVYETLLLLGPSSITKIFFQSKLKKGDTYNVLRSLEKKGLVKESKKDKTIFSAEQPRNIQSLLFEKQRELTLAQKQLSAILPDITSLYHLKTERPIISVLNGVNELKSIYDDMLQTKTELLIFVSSHDWDNPEMKELIKSNIKKQKRKGIKVRALNPLTLELKKYGIQKYLKESAKNNISVRFLPVEYTFPSQITIYEDKVVITSLKQELITTFIQNVNIANTLRKTFEFMWLFAKK